MSRAAAAAALALAAAAQTSDADWPMLGHGTSRTTRSLVLKGPAAPDQPTLAWANDGVWRNSVSPVVGAGRVYSAAGGVAYALDAATGTMLWTYDTSLTVDSSPALGSTGFLYVCGYDLGAASAFLFAIEADSGALKWTYPAGNVTLRSSPAVGPDGTVYFGASSYLLAIDGQTGRQRWQSLVTDGPMDSAPALSTDNTLVYASSSVAFTMFAVYSANGTPAWFQPEPCAGGSCGGLGAGRQAVGSDGTLFSLTFSGTLTARNGATGATVWAQPVATLVKSPLVLAVGVLDLVYVSCNNASFAGVRAYNSATGGQLLWERALGLVLGAAVGADGTLFVANQSAIIALSGLTGETFWARPCPRAGYSYSEALPALGPGKVLFAVSDNGVRAIGAAASPAPPPASPVDTRVLDLAGGAAAGFVAAVLLAMGGCAVRRLLRGPKKVRRDDKNVPLLEIKPSVA